jgi:hypothetical protein
MKISIHDTVQNLKRYTTEQGPWFQQTERKIFVNDKEQFLYKKATKNSRSILSNLKNYWRNNDQYQFLETEDFIYGEPVYIKRKKGQPVTYTITSGPEGERNVASI